MLFRAQSLLQLGPGAINSISDAAQGAVQGALNDPAPIDGTVVQEQLGLACSSSSNAKATICQ